jgi:polyhydroxyalkanoate synthesis regulator phasin
MMKKFPDDDQLRVLYRKRASAAKPLAEAGIPQPKKAEVSQVTDAKRMGAAGKQSSFPELSDAWYYSKARKLIQDYGGNLEYNWEKLAVDGFCKNMHLTSKIEVDDKKLYDTLMKMIDDSNDRSMKRDELKETIEALEKQALIENTESYYEMEEVNETPDPVRTLAESKISHGSYVEKAERLFNVRHSIAPASLAKYYQGEGKLCETKLPVVCRLPHTEGFRQIDEKALDRYCEAWNAVQESNGEPVKIDWSVHPDDTNGKVSFKAILR